MPTLRSNLAHGQVRVSNELRQRGIFVSPSGVRSVWLRNDLASFKRRLMALEKQLTERGIMLTDAQIAALEKKQDDDIAHGVIETAHPGYLGSQDTFYVGTIKGVGRIYQQTFVDTYSKNGDCQIKSELLHFSFSYLVVDKGTLITRPG